MLALKKNRDSLICQRYLIGKPNKETSKQKLDVCLNFFETNKNHDKKS